MTYPNAPYFSFFTFGFGQYLKQVLSKKRDAMLKVFLNRLRIESGQSTFEHTILDVGVSDLEHHTSNMLEQKLCRTHCITGLGLGDFEALEKCYPNFTFVKGDARQMPFNDKSFDFVYSHAVIEHVGKAGQLKFIKELVRVARHGVFFTTPNRYHPFEFHTGLPLFHFLPSGLYQRIFSKFGKSNYDTPDKLLLLSKKDILDLLKQAQVPMDKVSIDHIRWFGFKSNILVTIRLSDRVEQMNCNF